MKDVMKQWVGMNNPPIKVSNRGSLFGVKYVIHDNHNLDGYPYTVFFNYSEHTFRSGWIWKSDGEAHYPDIFIVDEKTKERIVSEDHNKSQVFNWCDAEKRLMTEGGRVVTGVEFDGSKEPYVMRVSFSGHPYPYGFKRDGTHEYAAIKLIEIPDDHDFSNPLDRCGEVEVVEPESSLDFTKPMMTADFKHRAQYLRLNKVAPINDIVVKLEDVYGNTTCRNFYEDTSHHIFGEFEPLINVTEEQWDTFNGAKLPNIDWDKPIEMVDGRRARWFCTLPNPKNVNCAHVIATTSNKGFDCVMHVSGHGRDGNVSWDFEDQPRIVRNVIDPVRYRGS